MTGSREGRACVARAFGRAAVLLAVLAGWAGLGHAEEQAAQTPSQTAAARPAPVALPPAEAFFQRPAIERTALSPSGRWLAMGTRSTGARTALVVFDLQRAYDGFSSPVSNWRSCSWWARSASAFE